jgi:hypothetical protein
MFEGFRRLIDPRHCNPNEVKFQICDPGAGLLYKRADFDELREFLNNMALQEVCQCTPLPEATAAIGKFGESLSPEMLCVCFLICNGKTSTIIGRKGMHWVHWDSHVCDVDYLLSSVS